MKKALWSALAWMVSREPVANYLIRRAKRTPYFHLDGYMDRWHLFNAPDANKVRRFKRLPWVRLHWIKRRDLGRHQHNHPWSARTIILRGWYVEKRGDMRKLLWQGDTAQLETETFHEITDVSRGGVWTLFFCWPNTGDGWGFKTERGVVPWREYLGIPADGDEQ